VSIRSKGKECKENKNYCRRRAEWGARKGGEIRGRNAKKRGITVEEERNGV